MTRKLFIFILGFLSSYTYGLTVHIDGLVSKPDHYSLKDGSRLNDLFKMVLVNEDAFFLGASWFQKNKIPDQLALKTGILFDLSILAKESSLNGNKSLTSLAERLFKDINSLPVTGRVAQTLDPAALIKTRLNRLLSDGDRLYFPKRPKIVSIIGATPVPCNENYMSMKNANFYLDNCKIDQKNADPDFIYIIQADGNVKKEGIGLWNREKPSFITPGAIIFIPIKHSLLPPHLENLNSDISNFWATQPISEESIP